MGHLAIGQSDKYKPARGGSIPEDRQGDSDSRDAKLGRGWDRQEQQWTMDLVGNQDLNTFSSVEEKRCERAFLLVIVLR